MIFAFHFYPFPAIANHREPSVIYTPLQSASTVQEERDLQSKERVDFDCRSASSGCDY